MHWNVKHLNQEMKIYFYYTKIVSAMYANRKFDSSLHFAYIFLMCDFCYSTILLSLICM